MRYFKRLALILIIFLILLIVVSLFLPSSINLKREIVINTDQELIFNQVNDIKKWENWSSWVLKDSTIYTNGNYTQYTEGVGAIFTWESDNDEIGSGTMEIVESIPNNKVEYGVKYEIGDGVSAITLSENNEGINVEWAMNVEFGFNPLNKFFGLFMKNRLAADCELGLKRLKIYVENLPKINTVKVVKDSIETQWFLSIRDKVNQMEMTNIHGKIYAQINQYMGENEIEISGSPIVIYHFWSDTIVDIEAGFPISDSIFVQHDVIRLNKLNKGNVVTAIHYGPYDRLIETYFGINEWMRKNHVVVTGPPWERYITDPTKESNPEKWQTAIYFPIE